MFLIANLNGMKFTHKNDPTSPKVVWYMCGYDQHPEGAQFILGITFDSVSNRTRTGSFKWNEIDFVGDIIHPTSPSAT
jgi:hypothetical protein